MKEEKTVLRLAIISLLLALSFQTLQYVSDQKFQAINSEFWLKITSAAFFKIALPFFVLYISLLSLEYGYHSKFRSLHFLHYLNRFLYDFSVTLNISILAWSTLILLGFQLEYFIKSSEMVFIILMLSWFAISWFCYLNISPYVHEINMFLNKKFNDYISSRKNDRIKDRKIEKNRVSVRKLKVRITS